LPSLLSVGSFLLFPKKPVNMTNTVELLGHYGGDLEHALSAWTSTSRELTDEKRERIPALLKMLAEKGHETPFEKSSLHFLCTVDQATHIHLLKHRIGVSVNAESARYKELQEDRNYLPFDWPANWIRQLDEHRSVGDYLYRTALRELTPLLGRARAKESARYFKTMNSQLTLDVMFNFRSFVHFQRLRNAPTAQHEVRLLAGEMLQLVKMIDGNPFEHTIKAFGL
jgi:flavin-dependent thymidylate synthase